MSEKVYEFLGAKIPKKLDEEIDRAVEHGHFLNRSELMRSALRELLSNIENVEAQES